MTINVLGWLGAVVEAFAMNIKLGVGQYTSCNARKPKMTYNYGVV